MYRGAWWATVHGVARVRHNLATKQLICEFGDSERPPDVPSQGLGITSILGNNLFSK